MRKARSFFYVAAGLFLLVSTYHFGVRSAGAQSGGHMLVDVAWRRADGYAYAVTSAGDIYAGPGYCQPLALVGHMPPGLVPVCVLDGDVGGSLDIGCSDGSMWTVQGSVPNITVVRCADVFSAPTAVTRETFGGLKVRYRTPEQPKP